MIRDVISGSNTWLVLVIDRYFFFVYPYVPQSLKRIPYIIYLINFSFQSFNLNVFFFPTEQMNVSMVRFM